MVPYLGDFAEDATVYIMFNTFTSDDPSASATITNFINTDVHIHKDNGLTQRNNAAGITVSVDFDGITGSHMIVIDTSDDTVGGFWVTGSDYFVRIEGTTVDVATVNAVVGHFSIENRFKEVDLTHILGHLLTNTGTQIADAFQTMYDVSSPVLTAQSVNQTANNNTILAHADYGNAKLVRSTTPANKLDVSATGEAGLDFNNVKVATGATTLTNITVPTVTTVTNQLTAAAIATGIWQDTTAEDFTTSASIGKSLFTSGAVPGAAGGLFIAGTNAATIITTGLTTHFIGTVDTVTTYTGNTKQTADNNVILAHATYGLSALRTRGDLAWVTGAGTSTLDAAGVRAAVGLASANLDTQLADLPTVSEFNARSLVSADYFVVTDYTAPLDAAGIRTAVGLASANLDTQLGTITTAVGTTIPAALTTIAGYTDLIDDATSGLAKIASYIDTEIGTIVTAVGTTIPAHLTDIKGTGFVKDTDSLVNLGHIGADGDTLETLSDQMDVINGGAGAVTDTVTVYADDGSTPLDGAEVSATNDVAGVDGGVARARQYSDTNGEVTFKLDEGDYWIHVQQGGYMFTTTYPKKMTVSSTSFDWS